jgi:hypothetical protein
MPDGDFLKLGFGKRPNARIAITGSGEQRAAMVLIGFLGSLDRGPNAIGQQRNVSLSDRSYRDGLPVWLERDGLQRGILHEDLRHRTGHARHSFGFGRFHGF